MVFRSCDIEVALRRCCQIFIFHVFFRQRGCLIVCGTNIREARVIRRISQTELAARMQLEGILLERDSISRIENGVRFVAD